MEKQHSFLILEITSKYEVFFKIVLISDVNHIICHMSVFAFSVDGFVEWT